MSANILSEFNAMGKPIPHHRRSNAYETAKAMGLDSSQAMAVVTGMAEQLSRDKPFEAQKVGLEHLDLTGTYRLMAVLLTG